MRTEKPPLWTRSYIFACVGNFLSYFGFCMVLPVFPMLLINDLGISGSKTGIIIATFTFSAMISRLFFAYLSDLYNRKIIYCAVMLLFSALFLPYTLLVGGVAFFVFLRIIHGAAFGAVSVSGNAALIDIVNEKRRGEGFGFFGISNNLGMAIGTTAGLYIYQILEIDFYWVFISAFLMGAVGFLCILQVKLTNAHQKQKMPQDKKFSFDKIYQVKGVFAGLSLLLLSFPYGLILSFAPLYATELGIDKNVGLFFVSMSVGLVFSRITSGKLVDRGKLTNVIKWAAFFISLSLLFFAMLGYFGVENIAVKSAAFYIVGFMFGLGYGMIFPAFNTLFVNLAPDNRRAAASSTYLTNWDIGLGSGLILGGIIMEKSGMSAAYLTAAATSFVGATFFVLFGAKHFLKHKLR
jgi:MFS family permease